MESKQPKPAATVVLVRDAPDDLEILMLLRNSKLVFNGGHWVFPGGRIDAEDYLSEYPGQEYHAARQAAVRETNEEAGIDIDVDALIHTAHWTTPDNLPRRFSTWFFMCPLYDEVDVTVDQGEILDYQWITPARALEASNNGEIKIPRPTTVTLQDLQPYSCIEDVLTGLSRQKIRVFPKDSEFYRPKEMGFISRSG